MVSLSDIRAQRCQVKGCRRPRFLGGRCGYHALELAPVAGAAAHQPTVKQAHTRTVPRDAPDRRRHQLTIVN